MASEAFFHWKNRDLIFNAKIQPRARHDEWITDPATGIRIRIKAPPVDGQANRYVLAFLASLFGVKKGAVTLLSGESSRYKRFKVSNPSQLPEIFF